MCALMRSHARPIIGGACACGCKLLGTGLHGEGPADVHSQWSVLCPPFPVFRDLRAPTRLPSFLLFFFLIFLSASHQRNL